MGIDTDDWAYESVEDVKSEAAVDWWGPEHGMPTGYAAWIERDCDAENPRDHFDVVGRFVSDDRYIYSECSTLKGIVRDARDYGWDEDDIRRCLEEAEGEVWAWDRFDFGDYGAGTMWCYVPKLHPVTLLGSPKYADPVQWLAQAQDEAHLRQLAQEWLQSEVAIFKQWDAGDVYVVTVCNLRTGYTESVCGVYDESPYKYCRDDVVAQLIKELAE